MFHPFRSRCTRELAPKLAATFRYLVNVGSFPAWWRLADVFLVPKNLLSRMLETISRLLPFCQKYLAEAKLRYFLKSNSLLPPSQFLYKRSLGTCDALLTLSHHLQVALDRGMDIRLVQLDYSAAFGCVCHPGLLYKLRSLVVERQFLSIVSGLFSHKRQYV